MNRLLVGRVLSLGLLVVLVVLALSACGGGEEQATKPRPLPEEPKALHPGVYRSEEFKPSLTFKVGEGWSTTGLPELPDVLLITRGHEVGGLGFANIWEVYVYKPTRTSNPTVVEAPEDMVGWFQQHPYLRVTEPESVTVGGTRGERLDVAVGNVPKDYYGECGSDCVDLFRVGSAYPVWLGKGDKARFIVLESVGGETVVVGFISPASKFDEHAPEAQKVIESVEWRGS